MSELRLCPFQTRTELVRAMAIGNDDFTQVVFYPCQRENCMAYKDGECLRLAQPLPAPPAQPPQS